MLQNLNLSTLRRRLSRYSFLFKPVLLSLPFLLLFFLIYSFRQPLSRFFITLLKGPASFISLTKDPSLVLASTNDRTNLLLLGMGGEGHEAPLLTDSLVVISYHHQSDKITLISLPRDLWVDSLRAKINTAYYYGEQKQKGSGLILAKAAVFEVTNLPIHYAFAINFDGFQKAIDLVGGIQVNVEHTFDDYKYPIPGREDAQPESSRYEHLHFDAGSQHLNGALALKFVRSRNALGEEGTDFARSARQQKVILAFKDRLLSHKTLLNPQKISELLSLYRQSIDIDIPSDKYGAAAKLALSADTQNLKTIPLTTGDPQKGQLGILENPPTYRYQGQWVLIARDNNWKALHQYLQNELNQ